MITHSVDCLQGGCGVKFPRTHCSCMSGFVTQSRWQPLSDNGLDGMMEEAGLMSRLQQEHLGLNPSARGRKKVRKLIDKRTTTTTAA